MKIIKSQNIYEKVQEKLEEINTNLNPNTQRLFESYTGPFANEIRENIKIAKEKKIPLCQDTGIVEFFVFKPYNLSLEESLQKTLFRVVKDTYEKNGYRKSTVLDPLYLRKNKGDNLPAIIHEFEVETSDGLEIWMIAKGGGSENLSALYMIPPSSTEDDVINIVVQHILKNGPNACPPINVGIGIGGTADMAILISRFALFTDEYFPKLPYLERYDDLAQKLHSLINELHIGVQALGFGPTCQSVKVYAYPTHIATLPIAISVDCYLSRTGRVVINE
ncbi:hydro-lyase, Fe-S type, tartrate/fumarate subfamily [Fervidobacterium pennivorans DSM 9078]|uniref:Hydro-lyase, Fe-S type, tartrate/fumarate subfamily n=1 Tax=Fervidobacterium pennivorans (strain DSM 9078 / Ven5) TaxID=771875 RepID=H9UB60_FERPD|nr:fumarate hydratase [Fervidobacterium pennivorans]AFG34753.1 hydro-lyase, Fe-S type, tartrate/fumarate subfamily [Fervidobacterium pennivorans DSM 9078]